MVCFCILKIFFKKIKIFLFIYLKLIFFDMLISKVFLKKLYFDIFSSKNHFKKQPLLYFQTPFNNTIRTKSD
jgi:hypothetical protein